MTRQDQALWQSSWLCHYLVLEQKGLGKSSLPGEEGLGDGSSSASQGCQASSDLHHSSREEHWTGRVIKDESPNIYQSKLALRCVKIRAVVRDVQSDG